MNNIEIIKSLMDELHMNQREFSAYAGVSYRTVNTWITGERQVPDYMVSLLERLVNYDVLALGTGKTEPMMRWAVIDTDEHDEFITVCGTKADAIREGQRQWSQLTEREKERRQSFCVGLINVQLTGSDRPFEKFTQAELDDGSADGTVYEVAKEWR